MVDAITETEGQAMKYVVVLLVIVISGCTKAVPETSDGTDIVRGMTEAINARELDRLQEFVADDMVRHSDATPGVVVSSLAEFRAFLESDFASVPDSIQTIEVLFGNGEYVGVRARYRGTQQGPMGPFPGTGKPVDIAFNGLLRIEDGKIAEIWVEWDNLGALMSLGHISPPG
jgi:predicted ester cyclase